MIKGLGRTPFGPRPTPVPVPVPATLDAAPSHLSPSLPPPLPTPVPPPPPAVNRGRDVPKEPDPAEEAYETLKRHIHMSWSTGST